MKPVTAKGANNQLPATETTPGSNKPELSSISVGENGSTSSTTPTEEKAEKAKPTFEQKLRKLEELQELADRRAELEKCLENVNSFYISPSTGGNLKLTDGKGVSFGISNPIVIGEIVHMTKEKLQEEITKIDEAFEFSL